jgi:hypothetical protein
MSKESNCDWPDQLDHRGRLHGQAGGFISKGGDIFSSIEQLRTAAREEHNYFDERTGKAKVLRTLGFRLVLTAPVLVSHDRLQQIQEEWRELPDLMGDSGRDTRQALDTLRMLAQNSQDSDVRAQMETVQRDLERAYTVTNETRDRTLKALIRMGAFLANKIEDRSPATDPDQPRRQCLEVYGTGRSGGTGLTG